MQLVKKLMDKMKAEGISFDDKKSDKDMSVSEDRDSRSKLLESLGPEELQKLLKLKMKDGGMVTKSRTNSLNKFYGK